MDEKIAILGILLISALAATSYFALTSGAAGMATQPYVACCCNLITEDGDAIVRSQIQTYSANCNEACNYYSDAGQVYPQVGFCGMNP